MGEKRQNQKILWGWDCTVWRGSYENMWAESGSGKILNGGGAWKNAAAMVEEASTIFTMDTMWL